MVEVLEVIFKILLVICAGLFYIVFYGSILCCAIFIVGLPTFLIWDGISNFIHKERNSLRQKLEARCEAYPLFYKEFFQQKFYQEDISRKGIESLTKQELRVACDISEESAKSRNNAIKKFTETASYIREYKAEAFLLWDKKINKGKRLNDEELAKHYSEIIEIEKRQNEASKYKAWSEKQLKFFDECQRQANKSLGRFTKSRYSLYEEVPIPLGGSETTSCPFLGAHLKSYSNLDTDYTLVSYIKENAENLKKFVLGQRYFKPLVYEQLKSFVEAISTEYDDCLLLLVERGGETWWPNADKMYKPNEETEDFRSEVKWKKYTDASCLSFEDKLRYKHIILFDICTTNERMEAVCKEIKQSYTKDEPNFVYISLFKELSQKEIDARISSAQKKKEHEELLASAPYNTKKCVDNWDKVKGIPHNFLWYYYPTTCDFELSRDMEAIQHFIWRFKDNTGNVNGTNRDGFTNRIISMLRQTFGDYTTALTFVCIAASTERATNNRLKKFSEAICKELGMTDGLPHIKIIQDAEPKHLGGDGFPKLQYDKEFFKNRLVVLFDDILTKGDSIIRYKSALEVLDCEVICAITLGKTTHTPRENLVHYAVNNQNKMTI